MKKNSLNLVRLLLLFLFLSSSLISISQEVKSSSKEVYLFKTYQDLKDNNCEYLGLLAGTLHNPFGFYLIYETDKQQEKSKFIGSYWGFKIGQYLFRFKRGRWNSPMLVRGIKEKVFYIDGKIILNNLIMNSSVAMISNTKNLILYSDDLKSDFIKISKFPKREKNNELYSNLISCFEKGLKRYGSYPKFKAITTCIDSFLDE